MAQSPNPPSVVLKTPAPTGAQKSQIAAAKAANVPNTWSAAADPIVAAGPAGTGLHMTRSGRYVNGAGMYQGGVTPQSQAAAAQNRSRPTPVKADTRGFVASPTGSLKTGAVTAKAKPTAKVILHPNGSVEIQHHAPTVAAPAAASATAAAPKPRSLPKPGNSGNPGAFGTTTDIMTPQTLANARAARGGAASAAAAPQTVEQQAQALLSPVEKATTDAINQRIAAQQAAINSSTQTLAGLMGKYAPASAAAYGGAEVGQAAVDAATGDTLAGQGQAGQDALAAKLAAIGADPGTTARLTGTAAANTAGAVGAQANRGSASLSSLIAQGASAKNYAATLPGIAGMYGLQSTKAAQTQGTTDTANAVAQLQAKYPDLVQSIKAANDRTSQLAFENKLAGFKSNVAQENANTAAARAGNAQANSDRNYKLAVARYGLSEAKLRAQLAKDQQTAQTKGKLHGLSQTAYQTQSAAALGLARVGHVPYTDPKTNAVHPPVSWQQYLNGGLAKKIPMWILIEQGRRVYSQPEIRQGLIPGTGPKGK